MIKTRVQDRDQALYSSFESLGLRYLIQFGKEKESISHNIANDDCVTNARQICMSNLALSNTQVTKDLGSGHPKSHQHKHVDHVVQRPRAVLSSPDNDRMIGEMNKKANSKRGFNLKTHGERFNLARVDGETTHIKICDTSPTFNTQNRSKIKNFTIPSNLKEKQCLAKLKY
ncbi:hypothetical protein R6Q59_036730 [Mikania micrantha]